MKCTTLSTKEKIIHVGLHLPKFYPHPKFTIGIEMRETIELATLCATEPPDCHWSYHFLKQHSADKSRRD